jgi:hypothetical protein
MSRFPFKFAALCSMLALAGCMYPPMYQQGPYGQQMYAPQGNFAQPGTIVVPPSNAPLYTPGGSTYSNPVTPGTNPTDSFSKPAEPGGGRFFKPDGEVPAPKDAVPGSDPKPLEDDLKF